MDRELLDDNTLYFHHAPLTVEFDGRSIPGAYVDHHAAHAAGVYYQSGMTNAVVLCFDGGAGKFTGSDAFVGIGKRLHRLTLPQLWLGAFYNSVAAALGVKDAGKLMGLTSYGKPTLYDRSFIGTLEELSCADSMELGRVWLDRIAKAATSQDYTLVHAGKPAHVLDPINTDIAASAQQTFEENVLACLRAMKAMTTRLGLPVENLCIAGGCALSCPTNTRAFLESGFARVFVEPACDDSGLCVGAALWAYHNLHGHPVIPRDAAYPMSPYLGPQYDRATIQKAMAAAAADLKVEDLGKAAPTVAVADIASNAIIGWFEGRSEIGPRALGHRSILADPRIKENWARTNRIKGREGWRPFAPAVLEEDSARWFKDMPPVSPYMLFTGNVVDPVALPAITHVDGTARVQTVTDAAGEFCNVLREFRGATDGQCSVVLNTSLNGPGEPIVETAGEAIAFLKSSDIDAVYIDGFRVSKN
jgi:carbamoyltransferase